MLFNLINNSCLRLTNIQTMNKLSSIRRFSHLRLSSQNVNSLQIIIHFFVLLLIIFILNLTNNLITRMYY